MSMTAAVSELEDGDDDDDDDDEDAATVPERKQGQSHDGERATARGLHVNSHFCIEGRLANAFITQPLSAAGHTHVHTPTAESTAQGDGQLVRSSLG